MHSHNNVTAVDEVAKEAEDAKLEIKSVQVWLMGTSFPKSRKN